MNNKTIGITTFCSWTSYGSMLQAYSLRKILSDLGYDSYILYDRRVTLPQDKYRIRFKSSIKQWLISSLNRVVKEDLNEQYSKSNDFIKRYMKIIYYNSYEEMAINYFKAEYYLAGSDQVFNPTNPRPGLFLDFVPDRDKRLTYACSMGNRKINKANEKSFRKYINNFDVISVREEDNIEVLKRYNETAKYLCHIDPTFLTSKEEWRLLEKPYPIDGKYVLVYPLYWDSKYNSELKKLHKQGYKVIGVFNEKNRHVYCNKALYDVGVQEFLWLVDHAEAVVTSSFHGFAFSTLFEKKTSFVINPDSPSRLSHITQLLGIENCSISSVIENEQDYTSIRKKILEEKQRSITYLRTILHEE